MNAAVPSPPLALGPKWIEADFLIETFGMLGVLAVVFVESGLLVGFLLPGDSLLFTAGLLSANARPASACSADGCAQAFSWRQLLPLSRAACTSARRTASRNSS